MNDGAGIPGPKRVIFEEGPIAAVDARPRS